MKKIIDCITYLDEDMLLDFRLNVLNNYVDYFVIVEAKEDHQGRKKKLNFDIENFQQFKHKIIYLIQEEINLLKFILNSDEIFILCELISIYINRKEFDEIIKKNRVLIITTFIQIFLKRFFIPLLLKHELYTLHQLFQK